MMKFLVLLRTFLLEVICNLSTTLNTTKILRPFSFESPAYWKSDLVATDTSFVEESLGIAR